MAFNKRALGALAIVLGTGLIGGAFVFSNSGDGDSDSANSADPSSAQPQATPPPGGVAPVVKADGDCRLRVDSVSIAHSPETVAGFTQAGIEVDGISPATRIADIEHSMRVGSSTQINCDATSGYIGLRGGIAWRFGDELAMEMRRMRLDVGNKTMIVFPKPRGFDGIAVADFDTAAGTRADNGDTVTF